MANQEQDILAEEMISYLEYLSKPAPNDQRQINYCDYITRFCAHYQHTDQSSQEGCVVVGSTREGIRLRQDKDDGDFDYLGYSWIRIPSELLEVNKQFPCYLQIRGTQQLLDKFEGTIRLSSEGFLPASVLKEVNEKAFPILKHVLDIVSGFESVQGKRRLHLKLKSNIEPGIKKVIYSNWKCDELNGLPKEDANDLTMVLSILRNVHHKFPRLIENIISKTDQFRDFLVGTFSRIGVPIQDTEATRMVAMVQGFFFPLLETFGNILLPSTEPSMSSELSSSRDCTPINQSSIPGVPQSKGAVIKFRGKASKDFIPAFMLTKSPDCIIRWCQMPHKWPTAECIDKIKQCNYYVVAKPAVKDSKPEIDFCFGFNEAELVLANALLPVEKKCILVLKAYMKKSLEKISEKLTTFHWKTALYRVLQTKYNANLASQHAVDSPENVMILAQEVVEYMTECWCLGELEHFFCESNLLAKFEAEEMYEIASYLVNLQDNLRGALQEYIKDSLTSDFRTEYLQDIEVLKEALTENHAALIEKAIVNLISKLVETDGEDKLLDALVDICDQAIPFLMQEMEGYGNSKEGTEKEGNGNQIAQDVFSKLKDILRDH